MSKKHKKKAARGWIFESCPCLWEGEGAVEEPTHSLSPPTKAEGQAGQESEDGMAPPCGSWKRRFLCILPFFPFTAAIALTLHFFTGKHKTMLGLFFGGEGGAVDVSICLRPRLLLLLYSSTLLSVLHRWQRGVPEPELHLGARRLRLPSVPPAGSGVGQLCKWMGGQFRGHPLSHSLVHPLRLLLFRL